MAKSLAGRRLRANSVLAWRLRRQFLDQPSSAGAPAIVRRLCGVQAQVASAARLAVATRQADPAPDEVSRALTERTLVKTWAMRGTLHLLHPADAGAYLSLVASARTWKKPSWQRTFVTAEQLGALTEAVRELLDGRVLGRDELVRGVVKRTADPALAEQLRSGWGAVLKPLAWQGYLCHGPADGNRVTFTSPDTWLPGWTGLPDAEEAAAVVIPAYLGAHGPATPEAFDQWLTRGASPKSALRSWFAGLGDDVVPVEVDGTPAVARAADVEEITASRPSRAVRLLAGFDQYLLGPGTGDTTIVAPARRRQISRAAGWISAVVVVGGRVGGTWDIDGDTLSIRLFTESGAVPDDALEAQADRLARLLGQELRVSVSTD